MSLRTATAIMATAIMTTVILAAGSTVFAAAGPPIVLHFAPGAITLRTQGRITPAAREQRYSLDVRKGQTLTFSFEGDGPLTGTIDCQGISDGPFSGYGDTFVVPKSGPCIVTILISPMAERWTGSYKLSIKAE